MFRVTFVEPMKLGCLLSSSGRSLEGDLKVQHMIEALYVKLCDVHFSLPPDSVKSKV